jgi:hypothetical protein
MAVVVMLAWPRNSCTSRMEPLDSSRCVAHECRLCLDRHRRHYVFGPTTFTDESSPTNFFGNSAFHGIGP